MGVDVSDWDDFDTLAVEGEDTEPYRFTWGGTKFEMAPLARLSWRDHRFVIDENDIEAKLRILLGDQFDAFDAKPMSSARMDRLIERWFAHQGITPGESSGSASS